MEGFALIVWQKLNKENQTAVYVGEKPKHKRDRNGKMHTLDERETENVSKKANSTS